LETILKGSDESGLLLASPLMDGSKWVTILGLSMISAILAQYPDEREYQLFSAFLCVSARVKKK